MKKKKLKIAIFCTTHFPIPLKKKDDVIYAPIDLVDELIKSLVKRGHKITLFASSDSKTSANLISCGQIAFAHHSYFKNLSLSSNYAAFAAYEQHLIANLYLKNKKEKFDIIHAYHAPFNFLPFTYLSATPALITLHYTGTGWGKEVSNVYKDAPAKFISISNSQRKSFSKNIKYAATIYNGLKINQYHYNNNPENYLLIAGRFKDDKGFHAAIKAAIASKHKLIIAGIAKVESEKKYFKEKMEPLIKKHKGIIKNYGLVDEKKIAELNKNAKAFLFPIQWEEPFGLVMIEAMACGTPVIAFNRGAVPEVVKDGKTGFIVNPLNKKGKPNIEGLVEAIKKVDQIDRKECRKHIEENFTIKKMVNNYEKVYYKIIEDWKRKNGK